MTAEDNETITAHETPEERGLRKKEELPKELEEDLANKEFEYLSLRSVL